MEENAKNNQTDQLGKSMDAELQIRKMSRRSFMWGATAVGAGYGGLRWINSRKTVDGIPFPFREMLQINEKVALALFNESSTSHEYDFSQATMPIENGDDGLSDDIDLTSWTMELVDNHGHSAKRVFNLHDVKSLPRADFATELRCVEGWATIVRWTGTRLIDFMKAHPPEPTAEQKSRNEVIDFSRLSTLPKYVGFETPDGGYYVGIDMASAIHHQTLLCYAMGGLPLEQGHGAPLRLVIPTKYGIKNLKRIGKITYSNTKPADFWAEQGYDYYAGL